MSDLKGVEKEGHPVPPTSVRERILKDRMRYILFFTSFSVILITLGIIQTLLFEATTFFSEVAEARGWFSFEIEVAGLASSTGLALGLLLISLIVEWRLGTHPAFVSNLPPAVTKPTKSTAYAVALVVLLLVILIDSFLLRLILFVPVMMWKRIINAHVYLSSPSSNSTDRSMLFGLAFGSLVVLFFSITTNYGGAFGEFFFSTQWTPTGACSDRRSLCENMSFGVNSLLLTTVQVAFGALFIAVPLGVGCAIYLSEYASPRLVAVVKPTLELLAGIPSVVYGFFAFIYIGPLVVDLGEFAFARGWIDAAPNVLNPINGAIVVGVMILPLIASMSEDALRAVPNELREGSLALGATKIETTFRVMIQAALSGILASIILALSRAVGETMAVTLAVGTVAVYTSNMFLPAQTMTAYIAQRVGGDLPFGEIGYLTIFAVGLYLFVITLCLNLLGNKVLSTYREAY